MKQGERKPTRHAPGQRQPRHKLRWRRQRTRPSRQRYEIAVPAMGGSARMAHPLQTMPRLVSGLALVVVGWLVYWFSSADAFYIHHLRLEGNWRVPETELLAMSGLDGVNIFWADTRAAERALEALPDVASAQVRCSLPAHCVVRVKERPALLVWQQGDAQIWVGADGMALPARGDLPDALVLDAVESTALKPGDRVSPALVAAVRELERLQPDVRVYQFSDRFGLSFRNDYGWPVRLGHGGDMAVKLDLVSALVNYLVGQGITPGYLDVRFSAAPYYGE